jgi:hypothetical protein
VCLTHQDGDEIRDYVLVPGPVLTNTTRLKAVVAPEFAYRLIHHIKRYHQEGRGDSRDLPTPKPDDMVMRELRFREKKVKEAVRPFCIQCGKEDRTKYPEWGPCPHEEAGEI